MDLIARYLAAVTYLLPRAQQADVINELSEDIRSQVDERVAELGRPLNEDEQEALLKPYGHPALLAARYRQDQHLIGPVLLPFYWFTLKVALGFAFVVHAIGAFGLAASGRSSQEIMQALLRLPIGSALMIFGWITLLYAVADVILTRVRFFDTWSVRSLPVVTATAKPENPRHTAIFELVVLFFAIQWWLMLPGSPWLIFGPHAAFLELAPLWKTLYMPVLWYLVAAFAVRNVLVVKPHWTSFRALALIALNAVGLVGLTHLLRAGDLVVGLKPAPGMENLAGAVHVANLTVSLTLMGMGVGLLVEMLKETYRLASRSLRPASVEGRQSPR